MYGWDMFFKMTLRPKGKRKKEKDQEARHVPSAPLPGVTGVRPCGFPCCGPTM